MFAIHNHPASGGRTNRSNLVQWLLWVGLAAAVAWLFFGHGAHLLPLAPFLILLACPLLHFFHGGHGEHASHSSQRPDPTFDQGEGDANPDQRRGGHAH